MSVRALLGLGPWAVISAGITVRTPTPAATGALPDSWRSALDGAQWVWYGVDGRLQTGDHAACS
jgi:hypothetical protein